MTRTSSLTTISRPLDFANAPEPGLYLVVRLTSPDIEVAFQNPGMLGSKSQLQFECPKQLWTREFSVEILSIFHLKASEPSITQATIVGPFQIALN